MGARSQRSDAAVSRCARLDRSDRAQANGRVHPRPVGMFSASRFSEKIPRCGEQFRQMEDGGNECSTIQPDMSTRTPLLVSAPPSCEGAAWSWTECRSDALLMTRTTNA